MWRLGPGWEDEAKLARAWLEAKPFPHLVFDDLITPASLTSLLHVIADEPVEDRRAEIYAFEASSPEPQTAELRGIRDAFAKSYAPVLARVTGKELRTVDMRAYAYRAGHYLLPHSDHQLGVGRALAYAYYLPSPDPPEDGALELFHCALDGTEIASTESARIIEPRGNRLVVFDVSDVSLHQVREVLAGLRISLAGWFYP